MLSHLYNAIRQWWNQHFLGAKSWGQWTSSDLFPSQWLLVWRMDDHKVGEQLATSVECEVVSYSFDLYFPSDFDVEHLFIYLLTICISVQILCQFLYWVVFLLFSFKSSWYILDISLLSDICFSSIFSHSVICLYFADGAFWRTNVLNFDKAQCICFSCVSCTAGVLCKKLLPRSKSQRLFSSFLLRIL